MNQVRAFAADARLRTSPQLASETLPALAWHIVAVTGLSVAFAVVGVGYRVARLSEPDGGSRHAGGQELAALRSGSLSVDEIGIRTSQDGQPGALPPAIPVGVPAGTASGRRLEEAIEVQHHLEGVMFTGEEQVPVLL